MELIRNGGFEEGSGTNFGSPWVGGFDEVTENSLDLPHRVEISDGEGFAARFTTISQRLEQHLYTPMYAWNDLILRMRVLVAEGYTSGCSLDVLLYYEGSFHPEDFCIGYRQTDAEEPRWQEFSVPTKRCSKLTKIGFRKHDCAAMYVEIDDIGLEGGSDYPYHCKWPMLPDIPYRWYPRYPFFPIETPNPPGFSQLPPGVSVEMPSGTQEPILSEMEYRLRSIEMQLINMQHTEYTTQKWEKPMSQQKDAVKHKA